MALEDLKRYKEYLTILNYSENTIKTYELAILQYLKYIKEINKELDQVEESEIFGLIKELKTIYRYTTINLKLSAIKKFYEFLKLDFPENVFIRNERKELYPLSDKQIKLFNDWLQLKNKNVSLPFKLMLNTGIRIAELTKLEITDFIAINNKYYVKINNTKNYSSRIIPLYKELYEEILEFYQENVFFGTVFDFTKRNYQYHIAQFGELFNIEVSLHTLRRTYATYLQANKVNIQVVQKLLGHKNISTTMIYVKITDKQIQELNPIQI